MTATLSPAAMSESPASPAWLAGSQWIVLWAFAKFFRKGSLGDFPFQEALNVSKVLDVLLRDEGNGYTVALGTCSTSDAVDIVLSIMRHVVVDDTQDVVNVDAS